MLLPSEPNTEAGENACCENQELRTWHRHQLDSPIRRSAVAELTMTGAEINRRGLLPAFPTTQARKQLVKRQIAAL